MDTKKLTTSVCIRIPSNTWEQLNLSNIATQFGGRSGFLRSCADIASKKANTAYAHHQQKLGGFIVPHADATPIQLKQYAMLTMFLRATPASDAETKEVLAVVELMRRIAMK